MTINLNKLFRDTFGYDAPRTQFNVPENGARVELSKKGAPYYDVDSFGVEHFMPIRLKGYADNLDKPFNILLPFAVVSVLAKKTVIKTPLVSAIGAVSEQVSVDDYIFNIKGILLSHTNEDWPEQQVIEMHEAFLSTSQLTMHSVLTDMFLKGDCNVIIRSIKWPGMAGVQHAQPFEMEVESDIIQELEDLSAIDLV